MGVCHLQEAQIWFYKDPTEEGYNRSSIWDPYSQLHQRTPATVLHRLPGVRIFKCLHVAHCPSFIPSYQSWNLAKRVHVLRKLKCKHRSSPLIFQQLPQSSEKGKQSPGPGWWTAHPSSLQPHQEIPSDGSTVLHGCAKARRGSVTSPKPHSQPYSGWGAEGADFALQVRKLCFLLSDILSANWVGGTFWFVLFFHSCVWLVGWLVCFLP